MRGGKDTGRDAGAAAALAILAAIGIAMLGARTALASINPAALSSVTITQNGVVSELHFGFIGVAPKWNLSAHGQELWINLPDTRAQVTPRPVFGLEAKPIVAVRVLDAGDGAARIVLEVDGKIDYAIARWRHQIVVRVAPAGAAPNLAGALLAMREPSDAPSPVRLSARPRAPIPGPREIAPLARASGVAQDRQYIKGHPLVMIDPGHGGYDPGTISASGIEEKTLALEIAARVVSALEARGINAAMTRTTDVFVPLGGRTKIANDADADLFVSIHLNSSPNPETTGIEVYYLNNTTDRATIRLARMENSQAARGYGAPAEPNLNYILTDLRQQYKATEAASLARMIDAQTVADLNAEFGIDVNALGAKMGPFYVLVGAQMPSVLIECGFLSSAIEAQRLASARYQQILADGIADAIVHYLRADAAVGNL
ncbi:MAG TPA: N-acetylmuramoyl-L-alanine amidase [Candidatus Binataceae bacterium]|nr:N-acetylmuramoyl-L-alanine amidase [Candidatus Binataceae bacterium]